MAVNVVQAETLLSLNIGSTHKKARSFSGINPLQSQPQQTFPDPKVFDVDGNGRVEALDIIQEHLNLEKSKVPSIRQKIVSEYVEASSYAQERTGNERYETKTATVDEKLPISA